MTRAQSNQTCKKCGETKTVTEFDSSGYIKDDGSKSYKTTCKICRAEARRSRYKSDDKYRNNILTSQKERLKDPEIRAKANEAHSIYYQENKEVLNAKKRTAWHDATAEQVESRKLARTLWEDSNKELIKAKNKAYHLGNKDYIIAKVSKWAKANPERRKEIGVKYAARHKDEPEYKAKNCENRRARSARINRSTPDWADKKLMQSIYLESQLISNRTGIKHEVDHIIPLQGKLVSGLHVQNNLRVITVTANRQKSNKFG